LDNFGNAVPITSLPLPSPFTSRNSLFGFLVVSLSDGGLAAGQIQRNLQRQINVVDGLSMQRGSHGLKVGVDFRRLSPSFDPSLYGQTPYFLDVPSSETGSLFFAGISSSTAATLLFRNLGMFAQDTWHARPRLTVTYGLRWDLDFVPKSISGPSLPAVTGFNLNDVSNLALAVAGSPPYKTTHGNVAPRLGIAYQLRQSQNSQTVLRGGLGVFFDLASSEVGNSLSDYSYPFGASSVVNGPVVGGNATFPLSSSEAAPPAIAAGTTSVLSFDPNLKLPYTLQWSLALEQSLGREQSLSATFIGSTGRRLIQTAFVNDPNQNFPSGVQLITNAAVSDYSALQLQFQRRLSRGLQALASYTWSHSIDTASAGSAFGNGANALVPGFDPNINRGPSDFDVRNAFSTGLTYDVPFRKSNAFANAIFRGWSTENVIQARSASPANAYDSLLGEQLREADVLIRPNLVMGIPLYLYGSEYPGGKIFNNTPGQGGPGCTGPFCPPPAGDQGNLGRNSLRGFGAAQWDFAVHRGFQIHDSVRLQFRAEMFNVLNHPNFGPPTGDIGNPTFGQSTQMLGQSLSGGNLGGGAFDPLYQIGGPRSIQLAMKLIY
jgi:hypothetical protein